MERRIFDASFKPMAIDLSYARGSVKEVADESGIDPGRLSKWRQKDSSPVRPTEGPADEQREIKRLQKELKEAQLERGMGPMLTHVCGSEKAVSISRIKSGIFDSPGETGGIRIHKGAQEPVSPPEKMCSVLKVSVSGYYFWLKHPISLRERKEQELVEQIQRVYGQSKCRYGSPRIAMELKERGINVSRPRVARVMRKHRTQSIVRKKYRVQTTDSSHAYTVAGNYLNRNFHAAGPAEKWASDLTYIRTGYPARLLRHAGRKALLPSSAT